MGVNSSRRKARWRWSLATAIAIGLFVCRPSLAQDDPPPPEETIEPADREPLTYEVEIEGVERSDIRDLLQRSSELIAMKGNPPRTEGRLVRRIERDSETFAKVLRSQGFYAPRIAYEAEREQKPVRVRFQIDPGPLYRLVEYRIVYTASRRSWLPQGAEAVGLETGATAEGQPIADAQVRLVRLLNEQGYPLASVKGREAVVDHDARTMSVTVEVDQGPLAGYGPITFEGLGDVDEHYVRRLIPLPPGKRYNQAEVDKGRTRLAETQLFSGVSIEPGAAVDPNGNIPIVVHLTGRPQRTVGGSLGWATAEGFRSEAYWQHRSLFGSNEQFRVAGVLAELEQSLTATLRQPNFRRLDEDLITEAAVLNSETDAFDGRSARLYFGLQRKLSETWKISYGVSAEYADLMDHDEQQEFLLFGVPLTAARDATDSLLDPTRGHRLAFTLTPYYGTVDTDVGFLTATAQGSTYISLDEDRRYVFATRARIGSTIGAKLEDLPVNKRFYAGGGGSVRGYEFQKAGPLDDDDDPIGGRSLLEVGTELRIKITDTIGVVPFIDAGYVFDSLFPDKLGDLLFAAGIGGRYYTAFGPLRLDVAFPLNPRRDDDFFQFYVSIGQAF